MFAGRYIIYLINVSIGLPVNIIYHEFFLFLADKFINIKQIFLLDCRHITG